MLSHIHYSETKPVLTMETMTEHNVAIIKKSTTPGLIVNCNIFHFKSFVLHSAIRGLEINTGLNRLVGFYSNNVVSVGIDKW